MRNEKFGSNSQIHSQFFCINFCQVGCDVVWLVLPSLHACTSLYIVIMQTPTFLQGGQKTHKPGCMMCLVMTGYGSGYTCYKVLVIAPSLCEADCWVFLTWLVSVKYTVHLSCRC